MTVSRPWWYSSRLPSVLAARKRTSPRFVSARIVAVIVCSVSFVACGPAGDDAAGKGGKGAVKSSDDATIAASNAIRSGKLTTLPSECLQYSVEQLSDEQYLVEVRESHRRPECGDPETSPHLFDVRVDKRDGTLTTNANSPSGEFHPLPTGDKH
jgi:hypothetical protein